MEGKNAFIRSVQNGSTLSEAQTAGVTAVEDWYSQRQAETVMQANVIMLTVANQADRWKSSGATGGTSNVFQTGVGDNWPSNGTVNTTATLANGTQMDVVTVTSAVNNDRFSPLDANQVSMSGSNMVSSSVTSISPIDPDTSDTNTILRNGADSKSVDATFEKLSNEGASTETQMENFADSAYQAIQNDEITTSDLVDPYLQSREYSPDDNYGTWALSTLSAAGYSGPANLGETNNMTVRFNGSDKTGILLSDGLPSGGNFTVGETYNATTISGTQLFINEQDSSSTEITGSFTIVSANSTDGSEITGSIAYEQTNYNSSTVSGYDAMLDRYAERSGEIDARQANLRSGGGIGIGIPGLGLGLSGPGKVILIGGAALLGLLLLRD
jgi:hypothetical protein